ncbi:hypothetical protein KCP70_11205 [Salmonella enterica subsp. enterica]|nr:hypothetical protein KCP70_11205 [Salmonella enterica subsp. enterica]
MSQPRTLRELGIVLFLAVVGLKSGGDLSIRLAPGEVKLDWLWYFHHRYSADYRRFAGSFAKMNYLTLCGMLAGSMTVRQRWHLPTIFMPPAARRRPSATRIVSDVPAYYHATTAGGDFLQGMG